MKIEIKVLGTGCPKCKTLYANAETAMKEMNIEAEITKIIQIDEIMNYGVMITPALVINGKVKIAGRIPTVNEIKKWIEEASVKW